MPDSMHVFDRALLRLRRDRAAGRLHAHGFLLGELAARLTDRLLDFKRRFPRALDLGCHTGELGRALGGTGAVDLMFQADPSAAMARQAGALAVSAEEDALPFGFATLDLVVSAWSLHWVNDLPGALVQIRRALKPDGLFLAALAGSGTLGELRESLIEAELDSERGAGPRVSPFMDGRELAALLERAGFALPVVDVDRITVTYADAFALMRDLRGMGESNALLEQRRGFSRPATRSCSQPPGRRTSRNSAHSPQAAHAIASPRRSTPRKSRPESGRAPVDELGRRCHPRRVFSRPPRRRV